ARLAAQAEPARLEIHTHRQEEWVQPLLAQPAGEIFDVGLVRDRWKWKWAGARRLGRVVAAYAVGHVEVLGAGLVWRQIFIADRPGRRDTALVLDRLEVGLPQARQRGAVDLGITADIVVHAGVERPALSILPGLLGLVALLVKHRRRAPVLRLLRQKVATLEQQHSRTAVAQCVGQRPAPRTRADDDDVICRVHYVSSLKRSNVPTF